MKKFLMILLGLSVALAPMAYATLLPDNYTLADLEGDLSDVTVGTIMVSAAAATAADGVSMRANGFTFEGATADAIELHLISPDPASSDKTVTLPNATTTLVGTDTTDTLSNKTFVAPVLGVATGTSVAVTGSITSSAATTIGWSVVAGANAACSTTCTNACVLGFDNGAADAEALVDCADTTADVCVCAGAN